MDEVSRLQILVESDGVVTADKRLDSLAKTARRTETATGSLWSAFSRLVAPLLTAATALAAFNKALDTTTKFENYRAQLRTATGTVEGATTAFAALQKFAMETPYALQESLEAFIQLTNRGLTPSEEALKSYGNTASALGYKITDMAYAISAATAGEFLPLRKFGIQASKEADGIAITFQGVTTKVKNNINEIEGYFIGLGQKQFAGAMDERMKTLGGRISNLGDAWDALFDTIGRHGFGDVVGRGVDIATEAIQRLTISIGSGELVTYIKSFGVQFRGIFEDAAAALNYLTNSFSQDADVMANNQKVLKTFWGNFFDFFRYGVQLIGGAFGTLYEYVTSIAKGIGVYFGAQFTFIKDEAIATFKEIASWKPGADSFDFGKAQAEAMTKRTATITGAFQQTTMQIVSATDAFDQFGQDGAKNLDSQIAKTQALRTEASGLYEAYVKRLEIEKALHDAFGDDDLKGFGSTNDKSREFQNEEQKLKFRSLKESLEGEEQAVQDSYDRRLKLIYDNTDKGDAVRSELEKQLNEQVKGEMIKAGEDRAARLLQQYAVEEQNLKANLDAKIITEQEFQEQSLTAWTNYINGVKKINVVGSAIVRQTSLESYKAVLGMAGDISAQISDLVKQNNGAAKAMFVASKAIAIAQAIVNTELGATAALTAGPFLGIPMATLVRATGYASVALMAAQGVMEFSGKYEHGGMIPGGQYGLVGETGIPELVKGPAIVQSARSSEGIMRGWGNGGGTNVAVNIMNYSGEAVSKRERDTPDGKIIEVIVGHAVQKVASDITNGSGPISSSLDSAYRLRRGVA